MVVVGAAEDVLELGAAVDSDIEELGATLVTEVGGSVTVAAAG
jgi:hypothetical protein